MALDCERSPFPFKTDDRKGWAVKDNRFGVPQITGYAKVLLNGGGLEEDRRCRSSDNS
jgi:hypothetical protein